MKEIVNTIEKIKTIGSNNGKYTSFIKYCEAKKSGLRKEAFKSLKSFLDETDKWSEEEKRNFLIDIFQIIEANDDDEVILPHPLKEFFIKVLRKWNEECKTDSRPYRWLGMFMGFEIEENSSELLKKAIELGGESEQGAVKKLLVTYISGLDFDTHELPASYLGDLEEDIKEFGEIIKTLNMLKDEELRLKLYEEIKYLQDLILDWNQFLKMNMKDFESWRKEQGKIIHKTIFHGLE
ncbi:MAG: hypothetical protein Q8936_25230 [Bacillota bacterium]|nr:hypothetical protein [Bacillota bacterium]